MITTTAQTVTLDGQTYTFTPTRDAERSTTTDLGTLTTTDGTFAGRVIEHANGDRAILGGRHTGCHRERRAALLALAA